MDQQQEPQQMQYDLPATTSTAPITQAAEHQNSKQVFASVYSGVPVFEMQCRQVSVMRRRADKFLNATQILKVAGVDKGRRTKILEREVQTGQHEKVQGGYGKYQGTWIPFERGVEIAEQYGVLEFLRPLFDYVAGPDDLIMTMPKKRRVSTVASASMVRTPRATASTNASAEGSSAPLGRKRALGDAEKDDSLPESFAFFQQMSHDSPSSAAAQMPHYHHPPVNVQRAVPQNCERYRAILMSIFLNPESHRLPDLVTNSNVPPDLDIDLVIDDQGHSSLHWASALARINVLQLLLNLGADPRMVNYNGESALIRAVLVTNNFDNDTFFDLLILLHASIDICDKKGRSVVHHIALTAGIKGRVQASRYYVDNMLAMMQKNGMDIRAVIDLQDKNGDTALNIAARIGNRCMVEQMMRAGANPEVPNRAGLRPVDFGLEDVKLASLFQNKGEDGVYHIPFEETSNDPASVAAFGIEPRAQFYGRQNYLLNSLQSLGDFESTVSNMEDAMANKDMHLRESIEQVCSISQELAESRKVIHALAQRVAVAQLDGAIANEMDTSDSVGKEKELTKQVLKLRALLTAHGISLGEMELSESLSAAASPDQNPVDVARVNQLIAEVLKESAAGGVKIIV